MVLAETAAHYARHPAEIFQNIVGLSTCLITRTIIREDDVLKLYHGINSERAKKGSHRTGGKGAAGQGQHHDAARGPIEPPAAMTTVFGAAAQSEPGFVHAL